MAAKTLFWWPGSVGVLCTLCASLLFYISFISFFFCLWVKWPGGGRSLSFVMLSSCYICSEVCFVCLDIIALAFPPLFDWVFIS